MTERRSDDDDDGRAAGNRSQTRPVPDAASFPPRSTFGTPDPLTGPNGDAAPRPAPAPAKPAGIWGQTIALGAAVPPPEQPHAAPRRAPTPGSAEPTPRAVVVMPAVHTGQTGGHSHAAPPPPPAPKAERGAHRAPAAQPVASDSGHPPAEQAANSAAEPLRVPSHRPPPTPFKSSQRGAPKGTLLMTGLAPETRPAGATPVAARPAAAQTVPLGGDGRLEPATPAAARGATPAAPGATRPMRAGGARPHADALEVEPGAPALPPADLSFAQTMPSVPPSAIPPQATAPSPPRTPPPSRAAQPGRDEIRLQLADADVVQGAPSSIPAGVPRRNPLLMVGGFVALALVGLIAWLLAGREPAATTPTTPAAEAPAVTPTAPPAPAAPAATTTPGAVPSTGVTPTPTPQPEAQPAPSAPKAAAEPAAKQTAKPKAASRRPSKSGSKGSKAPSDDVSAARDALRALEREPVLKVKPSKDESSDLAPADEPTLGPPAPGE